MIIVYVLIAIAGHGPCAARVAAFGSSTSSSAASSSASGRCASATRGPGLALIAPVADRLHKVNMQIVTMPVPAQDGITRDNVTVRVDAVVYFRVIDPVRVVVDVQNYDSAIGQVAQASLRSIIGKSDLDDLLSNRERLNQGLELMIDSPALGWGVHIDRVEIKDVALPESMKRSMSRQAEAERERRSRVITAEGELQASQKLAAGRRGDGRAPGRAAAAPAADRRRGRRGEELHPRAALPRRAAPLPRTIDTPRGGRSGLARGAHGSVTRSGARHGRRCDPRRGEWEDRVERPTARGCEPLADAGIGDARARRQVNRTGEQGAVRPAGRATRVGTRSVLPSRPTTGHRAGSDATAIGQTRCQGPPEGGRTEQRT